MRRILLLLSIACTLSFSSCVTDLFNQDIYEIPETIYTGNQIDRFWGAVSGLQTALPFFDSPIIDENGYEITGSQGGVVYNLNEDKVYSHLYFADQPDLTHYGLPGTPPTRPQVLFLESSQVVFLYFDNDTFKFTPDNQWVFIQAGNVIHKLHPEHRNPSKRPQFILDQQVVTFQIPDEVWEQAEELGYWTASFGHTEA